MWFIQGEASLVMNGFDLTPLNLSFPIVVDAVYLSVSKAIPTASVEVLVYEDFDGGSPVNAQVAGRTTTTISQTGNVRIPFPEPVAVNSPVMWVGFYLPLDFEFFADTSGSSLLTYWAWTPGTTFDPGNLASAQVLGPADGSLPVELDMEGIARINAEIRQTVDGELVAPDLGVIDGTGSVIGGGITNSTTAMQLYGNCGSLAFDREDMEITAQGSFSLYCETMGSRIAPSAFQNLNGLVSSSAQLSPSGTVYDVKAINDYQADPNNAELLKVPVTHCFQPAASELNSSLIGIAYGAPRRWELRPTVVFGNQICAEVTHTGFVSYFTVGTQEPSVNLTFAVDPVIDPHPMRCGDIAFVTVSIENTGIATAGASRFLIEDYLSSTNQLLKASRFDIPAIAPGGKFTFGFNWFIQKGENELHNTIMTIDVLDQVAEFNENDNRDASSYIMLEHDFPRSELNCPPIPEKDDPVIESL